MSEVMVPDDKLLDFVEHKRRNYLIGGAARTLATTALFAFGGLAVGGGIGEAIDNRDVNRLEVESETMDQAIGDKEEANKNLARVSQQLGEACSTKLKLYIIDGQLYSDDGVNYEDQAVDDLLREPSLPCGDSASGIRQKYQQISSANTDAILLTEAVDSKEVLLSELELKAESDNPTKGWRVFGTLVGAAIGLIRGNKIARKYNHKKKDELEESSEWRRLLRARGGYYYSSPPEDLKRFVDKTTWAEKYFY